MFEMQQLAEFQVLYPEIATPVWSELLKGIGKDTLMRVTTYLIGNDLYTNKEIGNKTILENWFSQENLVFAQEAYDRIENYHEKTGKVLKIVSVISCLKILQSGLEMADLGLLDKKQKAHSEIDLFFAMLVCNQNQDYNQTKDVDKIKQMFPGGVSAAIMLNFSFPTHDITNFHFQEYTACQVIKSLFLFKFLDSTPEAYGLLKRFYEYYQIAGWKGYFERVVPIILAWAERGQPSHVNLVIEKNPNYESNLSFLQKLALNDYVKLQDTDFIKLIEKPLLPINENSFRVIHPLFVSDKIYKGLYFLLNQLNGNEPKLIKNFRSWYTTHFSEGVLLREIVRYSIKSFDCLRFDDELKEKGVIGPPDCYLRADTDLYLIENKDIFINASIKSQYDFEGLIQELKKKLYSEDGRPVGLGQIINNIRKVLSKNREFSFDNELKIETTIIYPMLIVHDNMFDSPALNRILNIWFEEELVKIKADGLDISRVKPLAVINIDCLIEVASLLKNSKTSLRELLNAFYDNAKFPKKSLYNSNEEFEADYRNSLLSFSSHTINFLDKKFGRSWRSEELMAYLFDDGKID